MNRTVLPGEVSEKTKPVEWNSFTISEGCSESPSNQVDWYPLESWIISFFSSTLPTLIRHSAQKARQESNWSLSKVKSVCPLSFSPFVPSARLSDFHKIVKWIYEPRTGETEKLEKRSEENKMECDSTRLFGEVLLPAIKRPATVVTVWKKGNQIIFHLVKYSDTTFSDVSRFYRTWFLFWGSLTLIKIFVRKIASEVSKPFPGKRHEA